jgi:hypothetical protein
MDPTWVYAILVALVVIVVAAVLIVMRERSELPLDPGDSPYAVSTEGMKRCPSCGTASLVTDATCSSCGKRLPT